MSWTRTKIELADIPAIAQQGMEMAKEGNPLVEQLRCVYTLENDPCVYVFPLVDYVDNVPTSNFTSFSLYQNRAS